MSKLNRDDILRVAGEPVAWMHKDDGLYIVGAAVKYGVCAEGYKNYTAPLYTEAQLLAMYAKGAEAERDACVTKCKEHDTWCGAAVRKEKALPIAPTNTEGEQA